MSRNQFSRDQIARDQTEFRGDNRHTGVQAVSFLVLITLSAVVIWPLLARFGATGHVQDLLGPILSDPGQALVAAQIVQGVVLALLSLWLAFRFRWLALGTAAAILAIHLALR